MSFNLPRLFFAAMLIVLSCTIQANTLYFSAIPDEDATKLEERFQKLAVYLEQQLQVPVKYIPVKSYSASVNAFKNNQIQLAWFGGLSGVRARKAVPGSQAIAQGEEDTKFYSYLIASTDLKIDEADQIPATIKGKTFTFGSKGSTSGRLMPEYFIRQSLGDSPEKLFKRVGFSGNHSKTIRLVESGAYQVGAVNYKVWEKAVAEGSVDLKKVKVIWRSPYYVDYNWSIRADIDTQFGENFGAKIKQALLNMNDKALLDLFPRKKFISAKNDDYQAIEDTAVQIGVIDD